MKDRPNSLSLTFDASRYQEDFDRLTKAIDMIIVCREFYGDLPTPHYERYNQALTELYRAYEGFLDITNELAPYRAT